MSGFDTDLLGTFTRETARGGSQLDAARRKARKGMELSGLDAGLASEGSFGPDPFAEMVPWNVALIAWLDDRMGIEVVGMATDGLECLAEARDWKLNDVRCSARDGIIGARDRKSVV